MLSISGVLKHHWRVGWFEFTVESTAIDKRRFLNLGCSVAFSVVTKNVVFWLKVLYFLEEHGTSCMSSFVLIHHSKRRTVRHQYVYLFVDCAPKLLKFLFFSSESAIIEIGLVRRTKDLDSFNLDTFMLKVVHILK